MLLTLIPIFWMLLFGGNLNPSVGQLHYDGHRVLRLVPREERHALQLRAMSEDRGMQLDLWNLPLVGRATDVRVTPENEEDVIRWVEQQGIDYDVIIDDLQSVVDEERRAMRETSKKRRIKRQAQLEQEYVQQADSEEELEEVEDLAEDVGGILDSLPLAEEIYEWLDGLERRSNLTTLENIGSTLEGRAIRVVKIGTGASDKPYIFIEAGIHAREHITIGTALWIIDKLATGYNKDDDVTEALDLFDWYILPVANPDGYDYTHTHDRFWRKNRRVNPSTDELYRFLRRVSKNCDGVDLNRNFDIDFYGDGLQASLYCLQTYRGPWAFSERETKAMRDFLQGQPQKPAMFVSFHAFSQLWMYPWGYSDEATEDVEELSRVARLATEAVEKVNGRQFTSGSVTEQMGDLFSGLSVDWARGVLGVNYSYVIEMYPEFVGDVTYDEALLSFLVTPRQMRESGREIWAGLHASATAVNLTTLQPTATMSEQKLQQMRLHDGG